MFYLAKYYNNKYLPARYENLTVSSVSLGFFELLDYLRLEERAL
jgi:hypothetical protein